MIRRLVVSLAVLLTLAQAAPVRAAQPAPREAMGLAAALPEVSASSWILYDQGFDRELGSLNPDERRAIASTTKMMTALVVLERAPLGELVTVSEEAAGVGEAEIGLVAGEALTVGDLLVALLIDSANDAAVALAEHVGGSEEGFVALMNETARRLGLADTHFANPHGLDDSGHYSTARDLLAIALAGMENPTFADLVGTRRAPFPSTPDGGEREALTTNTLLRSYPGTFGVKTGFTDEAGLALVAAAQQDERRVYAVVLGSEDHFADTVALLEYGFTAFGLEEIFTAEEVYARSRIGEMVDDLPAEADASVFMSSEEASRVDLGLVREGEQVVVTASVDGAPVARVALRDPAGPELPDLREAAAWASRYWEWLWGTG
ncbi:MAG: D-alanyl-D-alanine carboxypeptidase family protein [Acidimicrobiia bacterium]